MLIDMNKIEKLHDEYMSAEEWNDILFNISHNINQILKNRDFDKYLKRKIDINIILNQDIENDPNAYVYKIDDNNYEIVVGKKLLKLLFYYSHQVINENLIFEKIKRNKINQEKLYKIESTIFYFWIDFICLHEWAHIINGHLDFSNCNVPYFEFNNKNSNNTTDSILIEMDADITASKVLINRFLDSLKIIKKEIEENNITLIENFYVIMCHLFDLFFQINGENIRNSHPSNLDRMLSFSTTFSEKTIEKEKFLNIKKEKLEKIGIQSIFKFTCKNLKNYKLNKNKLIEDFDNLTDAYFKFLNTELNQYKIFAKIEEEL